MIFFSAYQRGVCVRVTHHECVCESRKCGFGAVSVAASVLRLGQGGVRQPRTAQPARHQTTHHRSESSNIEPELMRPQPGVLPMRHTSRQPAKHCI